ncbi:hypothetical protein SADO_10409 [Salinisphaera dokdonensis CL-ES53]|uniref:Uncharacterized protein n=1 Tax=Salinisphaera dokdonensis CL-ES53 TaxID=1304272 RepID=A0ABV2B189_9GAMM
MGNLAQRLENDNFYFSWIIALAYRFLSNENKVKWFVSVAKGPVANAAPAVSNGKKGAPGE